MKKIFLLALSGLLTLGFTSCKNGDSTFDDFEGGVSVYFAYQNPVRTLVMGEDDYDTSLDNAHKCKIYATMGGAYSGRDIKLQIAVDNSLVDNVYFDVPSPYLVKPMPETYYKLGSNTIAIDGSMRGAVDVEFTDAFFNDPKSVENTYVIPLIILKFSKIYLILFSSIPNQTDRNNASAEYYAYVESDSSANKLNSSRCGISNYRIESVNHQIVRNSHCSRNRNAV